MKYNKGDLVIFDKLAGPHLHGQHGIIIDGNPRDRRRGRHPPHPTVRVLVGGKVEDIYIYDVGDIIRAGEHNDAKGTHIQAR